MTEPRNLIIAGPDPEVLKVVRWRCIDLRAQSLELVRWRARANTLHLHKRMGDGRSPGVLVYSNYCDYP
jgi:hypothetical protein